MIVRIEENDNRKVITIVDEDLVGKVFSEGEFILDLSSKYFSGKNINPKEIERILQDKKVYLVNFIGKESVLLGRRLGLVEDTKSISGIKYAFFLKTI